MKFTPHSHSLWLIIGVLVYSFHLILSTVVTSQTTLEAALSSDVTVYFGNNIGISSVITIDSLTNLQIDALGYTLSGAPSTQCFYMDGSTVTLSNMIVTNCDGANGGAIYVGSTTLSLVGCKFTGNSGTYGDDVFLWVATLNVYSTCAANDYNSGSGTLGCYSQTGCASYIADTMSGSCSSCGGSYSCCGATACSGTQPFCTDTYCSDPTPRPTLGPVFPPTGSPTFKPSAYPTSLPTIYTQIPSLLPTLSTSPTPLPTPTRNPTSLPSISVAPSALPSHQPSNSPSLPPTLAPSTSYFPTLFTPEPTSNPSMPPTPSPTITCSPGEYLVANTCQNCPIGRYSNESHPPWLTECTLCSAGDYNIQTGSASCIACESGKFSSPDRSFCSDCRAGEYAFNNTECKNCEYGTYAPSAQKNQCLDCPAGFHTNNYTAAISCISCDAGDYSAGLTTECLSCPRGKFSAYAAAECTDCLKGSYTDTNRTTVCLACAAGTYAVSSGASSCTSCSTGRYQSATSQTACVECIVGKFAKVEASTSCSNCETGWTSEVGATTCNNADSGYYLDGKGGVADCPSHSSCVGGTWTPQPKSNYWVERRSLKYRNEAIRCPRLTCVGSFDSNHTTCWTVSSYNRSSPVFEECASSDLQCKNGALGPLCGACKSGWVYSSVKRYCVTCETSLTVLTVLFAFALAAVVFLLIVQYTSISSRYCSSAKLTNTLKHVDSGTLRILWSNYQIVQSISWNLDIRFPYPFSSLLELLSVFSFDFVSLDCLFSSSTQYFTVTLWSCMPILFALFNYAALRFRLKLHPELDESGVWKLQGEHAYYFLLLTYLVLPPVSLKQFQAMDCLSVADRHYLRVDTSIECSSDSYGVFRVFNSIFIFIYSSVPIIWLVLLGHVRDQLNPAPAHVELSCYLRDNNEDLLPMRFLFSPYLPVFYYFEPLEMYRRILFIGVLPLLSADSSRKAALGVFFSLCSMTVFREMEPFHRPSNSVLAYVAQHAVFLTFSAALVIDTSLGDGLDPLLFGVILLLVNLVVFALALSLSGARFRADILSARRRREMHASKLENAVAFTSQKFATTFQSIANNVIPPSQCLIFSYCSAHAARTAIVSGLQVLEEQGGIVFTLHLPRDLDQNDMHLFPKREAMLACSIPRALLSKLSAVQIVGLNFPEDDACSLRFLSSDVLRALRPSYFGDIPQPAPWFAGYLLLPPHLIVRAYLITNLTFDAKDVDKVDTGDSDGHAMDLVQNMVEQRAFRSRSASAITSEDSIQNTIKFLRAPHTPSSAISFVGEMNAIRRVCASNGWLPLYHYTQPTLGKLILKSGFRMSTQGQGDGGVYFSTLGPASYHLGEDDYERNIIVDCFGEGRFEEYSGKGKLDLVLVYGAEPTMLTPAPGGRLNALMTSKSLFEALSLPHADKNFFIRADRILGAFLFEASCAPDGFEDCNEVLRTERLNDARTKDLASESIKLMASREEELREKVRLVWTSPKELHGSIDGFESHEVFKQEASRSELGTNENHIELYANPFHRGSPIAGESTSMSGLGGVEV